jgi:hypothetical protein
VVVYANGDVSLGEMHARIGNRREREFEEIWQSLGADRLRGSIREKECYCTTEMFLWPSIVYGPASLVEAMIGARVWERPGPVEPEERPGIERDARGMPVAGS